MPGLTGGATEAFFARYTVDGQIVIPRSERAAARELWQAAKQDLAAGIVNAVSDVLAYTACGTIWHPILEIHISSSGEAFVDDSQVDRSVLDVKGGILR